MAPRAAPGAWAQAPAHMKYHVPLAYGDSSESSDSWAAMATREVAVATRKTGSRVCRADVCHKGRIDRLGFCRMLFWHWAKSVTEAGERRAQRMHGLSLQASWNGVGIPTIHTSPPLKGSIALEVNYPFHFKMTPSMLQGPMCNHDLGILLRLPLSPKLLETVPARAGASGDLKEHEEETRVADVARNACISGA